MTASVRLRFTNVRTRAVEGQLLIGLQHSAKDASGERVRLPWIEMPPEDLERLIRTLQQVLEGAGPAPGKGGV